MNKYKVRKYKYSFSGHKYNNLNCSNFILFINLKNDCLVFVSRRIIAGY